MDRTFHGSAAAMVAMGLFLLLSMATAVFLYRTEGWTLMTFGTISLVLMAVAGFVDTLTARVVLEPESIVIVRNLIRREYARMAFVKASWSKGESAALLTRDGEWVKLPDVAAGGPSMANALRAWMAK